MKHERPAPSANDIPAWEKCPPQPEWSKHLWRADVIMPTRPFLDGYKAALERSAAGEAVDAYIARFNARHQRRWRCCP